MTRTVTQAVASERELCQVAAVLASLLPSQALVGLVGPLGSGKTRFVQGLAAAVGVPPSEVTSPTFVLCHRYVGPHHLIYHVDAYRLQSATEWWELGVEEWLNQQAWVVVEWADRVEHWFDVDYLRIELEITGCSSRTVRLTSRGTTYVPLLETFEQTILTNPRTSRATSI